MQIVLMNELASVFTSLLLSSSLHVHLLLNCTVTNLGCSNSGSNFFS